MTRIRERIEKIEDEAMKRSFQPPRLLCEAMATGKAEDSESLDPELARAWDLYNKRVEAFSKANPSAQGLRMVLNAMPRTFRNKVIESLRALCGEENEKQRTGEQAGA